MVLDMQPGTMGKSKLRVGLSNSINSILFHYHEKPDLIQTNGSISVIYFNLHYIEPTVTEWCREWEELVIQYLIQKQKSYPLGNN